MRLTSGEVILVDPWIEGNPSFPAKFNIDRVDIMLITHGHFDHIHDALPLARKFSPQIVAIYETARWLESKGREEYHRDEQRRDGAGRPDFGDHDARHS